ncbi:rna polymerase sigma factor 70 region 4 type 2 [Lucifera butyrica]|uniref:Rna polymerase sigma factor 70 region 4 type 2 n=1 Tax=Lucifera butyrica TaxID=1351585 RepID=A0A498REJ5_9FIRM|nr:sigma-70 family RNA polymerase sigma factor [Lucifera butyrica]VBB09425.1 rna polymerase sigma factor 70 region 4 type 2 [Lucifera butyrica]
MEELVIRAGQGDREALDSVCARFERLVRKYARQAHLWPVAEDALAEGRLAVVLAVREYDDAAGVPFAGFAASRVRYALWNLFKRERRRWKVESPLPADGDADGEGGVFAILAAPGDLAMEVEIRLRGAAVREILLQLPERQREVIEKTVLGEAKLSEAAAGMGMSVQAAHNLKKRGLARLKVLCAGM